MIFVLLTAYFQSPRLALISIGAVPGVLAGIAVILYFTNTSLNIESFMGSIMCLGVSVSNSVMLVTFIDEHWKAGAPSTEAAVKGASERLRPILMTACAMTVGMVPMALALERGSQMQAPLGRAVIGGLVMSTFATLLVVPSIFAVVIGKKVAESPSIHPADPDSPHFSPNALANHGSPEERPPTNHTESNLENGGRESRARTCIARRSLMRRILAHTFSDRAAPGRQLALWFIVALAAPGCHHEPEIEFQVDTKTPERATDPAAVPQDRPGRGPA